ncbi:GNAT family N-acetyltransferase [Pacificibacter sp. AS14]|uniref:GNAT family N-acetyltransferase n=1 Tax=Pacificibacter sp. AS14 TaxID=3135785 RepID=UPI00316B5CA7
MIVEIRSITAQQTLDLRQRVLWPNKSRAEMHLPGDENALNFGAYQNEVLVGIGSFFRDPDAASVFRLRKMAVEPKLHGQGIARRLIFAARTELKTKGATLIWCDARLSAAGFYQKCGFKIDTEVFQKSGMDYVKAHLTL